MQFAGRDPAADLTAGHWLTSAVRPGSRLDALLPPVFAATARVFHPAAHYVGYDDVDVRWAEVARANGTTAHPLMQWSGITGSTDFYDEADQSPLWEGAPARGHLPVQVADVLVDVLARHTSTAGDCWFGTSDAHPVLRSPRPRLTVGPRAYWLVPGPITLACQNMAEEPSEQSVNLWWPADRAWCVLTDLELGSTYVGGSAACIADLLADHRLEAAPGPADQPVDDGADTVNPPPD